MSSGADPNSGDNPNQVIAGVLDFLSQARTSLLDPCPRNIDFCRLAVEQSVRRLARLLGGDRAGWNRSELAASLLLVRDEVGAITTLLDSAAAFRRDMLKAVSAANRPHVVEIDAAADQKVRRVHVLG